MPRVISLVLACCVALAALLGPASVARAQPPDDQLGESLIFVSAFPQLRVLPAPTWFRPGVRVSYDVIGANFGGGGAASPGILQYDVVAIDAGWAMLSVNSFTDNGAGRPIPLGATPKVGLPAVGEIYIHPLVLANAESIANQNLSVTRLNKQYLGQTFQVVRFQSISSGGQAVWEFDTSGGLLMFYSRESQGAATQMVVRNFRTLALPTQGAQAPNWVRPGVRMDLTGTQTQSIPGAGNVSAPFAVVTQIQGGTPAWSAQAQQTFLNGVSVGTAETVTGAGQIFGAIWLPRGAPARIGGQEVIIDQQDPVTGAQIRTGRTNNNLIYVREINQAYETILYYNPTLGSLDAFVQTIATPTNTTRIELVRTGGSDLAQLNDQPELINTLLPPGVVVHPNPTANQTVRFRLPATTLSVGLPAGTVGEPFNLTVNTAGSVPAAPANTTRVGDPFVLVPRLNANSALIDPLARSATFQVELPASSVAQTSTPVLYYRNGASWQRLNTTYNASTRTLTANHNRSGLYAVFLVPQQQDPGDPGDPDDPAHTVYIPTVRRR